MGVQLQGIPETTLWTLYMRAVEAGRPDFSTKHGYEVVCVALLDADRVVDADWDDEVPRHGGLQQASRWFGADALGRGTLACRRWRAQDTTHDLGLGT